MRRGQIALETITAAAMLLLLVIFIFVQTATRSQQIDFLNRSGVQKTECVELQSAISTVQSVKENSQLELGISNDFNVTGNSIRFSDFYCYFSGNKINRNFSKGNVRVIKRADGNVGIENF